MGLLTKLVFFLACADCCVAIASLPPLRGSPSAGYKEVKQGEVSSKEKAPSGIMVKYALSALDEKSLSTQNAHEMLELDEWRKTFTKPVENSRIESRIIPPKGFGTTDQLIEEQLNFPADYIFCIGEDLRNINVTWLFVSKYYIHKIHIGDKIYSEIGMPSLMFSLFGSKVEKKLSTDMSGMALYKAVLETVLNNAFRYEFEVFKGEIKK